ncbi:dockerin type I repeat-containing protein [Candidatus Marinimicrobia bacterium]|nr:dockerin type I repeat-containing protein [Candidatus Neomarinimicrobiota bacterium]
MNNNYNIKIFVFLLFCPLGFLFSNNIEIGIKEFTNSGKIDALIDNIDDRAYLVQLNIKNDSLLNVVSNILPDIQLDAGPASYHRLIHENHLNRLESNLDTEFFQILNDNYIFPESRNYWSLTLQGNQYSETNGETDSSCSCIDGSDCVVVGYNDSWYNPFDYSGEVSWNFSPPYFDDIIEARVYVTGVQCDTFPISSETSLFMKDNECNLGSFQTTLSESYTTNGPYILPNDILNNIWCNGNLQPVIQSDDNYSVDWLRIELYYSCDEPETISAFTASDGLDCDYVALNWEQQNDISSYTLYRNNELLTNLGANQLEYIDYSADNGIEYEYCIQSQNMCGQSDLSCTLGSKKPIPDQVENINIENLSTEYIDINWTSTENTTFYNLYRDGFLLSVISNSSNLNYIDYFVEQNTTYEYCIESNNDCGVSLWSCISGYLAIADLGDINIDQYIDILDVVLLVNVILEIQNLDENQQSLADLNSDNLINILDIVLLANMILNID